MQSVTKEDLIVTGSWAPDADWPPPRIAPKGPYTAPWKARFAEQTDGLQSESERQRAIKRQNDLLTQARLGFSQGLALAGEQQAPDCRLRELGYADAQLC